MNSPARIISTRNISKGILDHNLIEANIRLTGSNRKDMNINIYRERIANIDWNDLFETTNKDLAYNMFENRVGNILDSEAPMTVKQVKKNLKLWIRQETKYIMRQRDTARDKAKDTDVKPTET